MKYEVRFTTQFKKDLKLAKKQGKNTDNLFAVIEKLANGGTLKQNTVTMPSPEIIKVAGSAMWNRIGC